MRNYKNNKIRLIDCVSDLALATIILGIGMMVLGSTMIIGSAISLANGYSLFGGSSSLLFFGITHGIMFIANGVLLSLFCVMVATTHPLAGSFTALNIFALICALFDVIVLITCAALGSGALGAVVSLAGIAISATITCLIKKLRTDAEKMARSQAYNVVYGLKKAG
jgi:hypothetical protein